MRINRDMFLAAFFGWMLLFMGSAHGQVVSDSQAYTQTIKRWNIALHKFPHKSLSFVKQFKENGGIDRYHVNKARDTIVFIPHNIRENEPIHMIYWFHGLNGFGQRTFSERLLPQFKFLVEQDANFIAVIPEMPWSQNTTTPRKRQGKIWTGSSHDNFSKFHVKFTQFIQGVLKTKKGIENPNFRLVMAGHSAGGSAIKSAARAGSLNEVKPEIVVFSDAGYGSWTRVTWENYVKDCKDCRFFVLARFGDKPHRNAERLFRTVHNENQKIKFFVLDRFSYSHGRIGDNALLLAPIFESSE